MSRNVPRWVKVVDEKFLFCRNIGAFYMLVLSEEECSLSDRACARVRGCSNCNHIIYHGTFTISSIRCRECTEEELSSIALYLVTKPNTTQISEIELEYTR